MGKAGTWIRNLVLGRRTENHKKIKDTPFSEENSATPAIFSGTLKESRQRWSFRRWSLSRTENAANKSTRSFNSIVSGQLAENVLFMEYQKDPQENSSTASATSPTAAQVRKMLTIAVKIPAPPQSGLAQTAFAVAAATRIQAAYRSYLARRALRALRGLVKLQALVRGHLVRKRMNATLKSLHALISIQVRARIQRAQAVDQDIVYLNADRGLATQNIQTREGFIIPTDYPNINKSQRKHNNNNYSHKRDNHNDKQVLGSGFFSSEQVLGDHQVPVSCCNLSEQITTTSSRIRNSQINDLPFVIPAKSADHILLYHDDYPWLPNYMCKTESSKAKVRSHSEPKQRPKRNIKEKTSRRSLSNNRMEVLVQDYQPCLHHVSFHGRPHSQKKKLIKLYRSTKHVMDEELSDSASTIHLLQTASYE